MLEDAKESDKLNICTTIWDAMPNKKKEYWENEKQVFLEACIERGIQLIEEDEEDESRTLKLAESISKMADSLDELLSTGINRKLLILYLYDSTGIGKTKLGMVLDAIEEFIKESREA